MEFPYSKLASDAPSFPHFFQPLLDIKLYRGEANIPLRGLIDSGADQTLIHTDIADDLYIDWKKGIKNYTRGISGGKIPFYVLELEIEIIGMPNGRVKSKIGFIDSKNVSTLLGQWGFLEHFKVTLDHANQKFFVERSIPPLP